MVRGKRRIKLAERQRERLEELLKDKEAVPRERVRAQVLLLSDRGWKRGDITEATGASQATIARVRRRFKERGMDAALTEDERSGVPAKISASDEQRIVALVCSPAPEGRGRWTVRLLVEEAVKRKVVKSIGRERMRVILRDHELKPWREKNVVHS
jgi:putative transposase